MKIRSVKALLLCSLTVPVAAFGQDEAALQRFFQGKRVIVKIDMPATKDGIDIYVNEPQKLRFDEYSQRIRNHGVSVKSSDSIMVTQVRMKDRIIEFHLGGGGYGTFADEGAYVSAPTTPKSARERRLEEDLKKESDARMKRRIQDELDEVRDARRREDARAQAAARELQQLKREEIRAKALQSGSRFNLRFNRSVLREDPATPERVMELLGEWVDFSPITGSSSAAPSGQASPLSPGADRVSPRPASSSTVPAATAPSSGGGITAVRKGMSESAVRNLLGEPVRLDDRKEGTLRVRALVFQQGDLQVDTEFVEDVLVRFRMASR
jgi:hypothetical protein